MTFINSIDNKLIKSTKKLFSDKKYRDQSNLFVAETYKVVDTLIKQGFVPRNILITKSSHYFQKMSGHQSLVVVAERIYEAISELKNGDGVIAIFNKAKKADKKIELNKKYIILNNIQNPDNFGSILRTATAFNIDGIIISNDSVDMYHPRVIRGCMGYGLNLIISKTTNLYELINHLHQIGIKVYATGVNNKAIAVNKVSLKNVAIVFGNEGNGLSSKEMNACDKTIYVPINPIVDSLNLSNAVAILAYIMSYENN